MKNRSKTGFSFLTFFSITGEGKKKKKKGIKKNEEREREREREKEKEKETSPPVESVIDEEWNGGKERESESTSENNKKVARNR